MADLITPTDFDQWALPPGTEIDPTIKSAACASASAWAMSYLRGRYPGGLTSWGDDIREQTCARAAWVALTTTGFNPEDPASKAVMYRAQEAAAWFRRVAERLLHPDVTEAGTELLSPEVLSDDPRGL
jgi:phage gp36-like protein